MRITFVLPYAGLSGGIRVVANIAQHLQRRGHRVLVVSIPQDRLNMRQNIREFLRSRKWPQPPRPTPSHMDRVDVEHRVLERPRPIVDADLPDSDVVVATWWETADWVHRLAPSKGAKTYFIQQYEVNFGFPEERVGATWQLPMHKIVCSQWLSELAKQKFGQHVESIVPNGVDLDMFSAPPRGKQHAPTVGLMYHTIPVKGCDVSLEAIARAKKLLPDLKLLTFGSTELSPKLQLPNGTRYFFLPTQEQIREIYSQCDVWLCASKSEGFHLPPHEAMACRTPVVSTRVGGPMDMVRDGVNGYLVNVGDVHQLTERLLEILRMPDAHWRQMSEAALATAKRFTWESATDKFEAALELALARARRGEIPGPGLSDLMEASA